MRNVHQTTVNVVVNDRLDRSSVVQTVRVNLQRLHVCLREACKAIALANRIATGFETMTVVSARSPSWGGHRSTGGLGHRSRS